MIELLYPMEGMAPLLDPRPSAFNGLDADTSEPVPSREIGDQEIFPVVTEDGAVIGRASRSYCHSGCKLLHPVVHLHLLDRNERIYLQKRSMKKDIQPGKWDTAVGGHVMYGESILEALHRESYEELALTDYNPIYLGTYSYDTGRDMELVNIFAAIGHFDVKPDMDEVDEGRWLSISQISEMAEKGRLTPNFKEEFAAIKDRLLALL